MLPTRILLRVGCERALPADARLEGRYAVTPRYVVTSVLVRRAPG